MAKSPDHGARASLAGRARRRVERSPLPSRGFHHEVSAFDPMSVLLAGRTGRLRAAVTAATVPATFWYVLPCTNRTLRARTGIGSRHRSRLSTASLDSADHRGRTPSISWRRPDGGARTTSLSSFRVALQRISFESVDPLDGTTLIPLSAGAKPLEVAPDGLLRFAVVGSKTAANQLEALSCVAGCPGCGCEGCICSPNGFPTPTFGPDGAMSASSRAAAWVPR